MWWSHNACCERAASLCASQSGLSLPWRILASWPPGYFYEGEGRWRDAIRRIFECPEFQHERRFETFTSMFFAYFDSFPWSETVHMINHPIISAHAQIPHLAQIHCTIIINTKYISRDRIEHRVQLRHPSGEFSRVILLDSARTGERMNGSRTSGSRLPSDGYHPPRMQWSGVESALGLREGQWSGVRTVVEREPTWTGQLSSGSRRTRGAQPLKQEPAGAAESEPHCKERRTGQSSESRRSIRVEEHQNLNVSKSSHFRPDNQRQISLVLNYISRDRKRLISLTSSQTLFEIMRSARCMCVASKATYSKQGVPVSGGRHSRCPANQRGVPLSIP
jgi:hypothetical protein